MLDPCLSWNDHIDYIGRKISAKLGILRKACKVIQRESCLTLYNAMTLPVFDYIALSYGTPAVKTVREYLDKLQKRAASIIEGYIVYCRYLAHSVGPRSSPAGTI